MSCEVKSVGIISDLEKVQEHLGFAHDDNWLHSIYYSVSPTGELIAFGHGSKLITVGPHWTSSHALPIYTIAWKGELGNPNDIITSILSIPIYGSNVTNGADWTCLVVGTASGQVIFYTDSGIEIFAQKWHNEQVQSIKALSGKKLSEEVHIAYLSCVCVLQGSQLFQLLKSLKQNISKNFSSGNKTTLSQIHSTISCRKWEYRNRNSFVVNDSVIVGSQKSCAFDHLLEQSLTKGFFSKPRSSPSQDSLVLGVGSKPYIGFYYAKEGFMQADLGDVAKAVANKVMSSLPSWLFKSSSSHSQEEINQVPTGQPIFCRFGICDIQRQAFNIWLAPGNELAAVSDNLSRIVLVDCNRGIVLRIWKGYRDAQCSFIQVIEKLNKGDKLGRTKCLFLVIFAPRRSCLEIWALQHGPKVAAFTVSRNGQLIYNTHGLMGVVPGTKIKCVSNTCLFLDPNDKTLKEISVPFHCALSDANSKTAKDIHLLRRLKMILRGSSSVSDIMFEIGNVCGNFQTDEIKIKCLEMMGKNKNVTPVIFKKVLDMMEMQLQFEKTELPTNDLDNYQMLRILTVNYKSLVDFYVAIKNSSENGILVNDKKLCLIENDLEIIQKLLDLSQEQDSSKHSARVKFQDNENQAGFIDYLNVFDVETAVIHLNTTKMEFYGLVGKELFGRFLEKGHDIQIFGKYAPQSSITSRDFMTLILYYWLEKPFRNLKCEELIESMSRLASITANICGLADTELDYGYNDVCTWWQYIREILLESQSALRSLLAAIVCRNIAKQCYQEKGMENETLLKDEEGCWEEVSQEAAQWSLLIGKLDDISVLGAILSFQVLSNKMDLPRLLYETPDCSLKSILSGGKGIIAELVSKWLTNSGVHPTKIVENIDRSVETNDPVLKYLGILREHFPFSLQSGILLCQMTWEYMCHWSKNLSCLTYLNAGLQCLNAFREDHMSLKHGLCSMLWNAHLKIPLEATKKLIHNTGKLPKEKLCLQDIGISDNLVSELLEHSITFFQHFELSLKHKKIELKFEEFLQNGQIPLPSLTLQQNKAIKEMLQLHVELCKVLHLIASLSLKIAKPITQLFDAMSNQTFFMDINKELPYSLPKADLVMRKQRLEFLCKAVSASVDLIREDLEQLYISEHVLYMERLEQLAEIWEIDKASIKKHEVVELYSHGWDLYADEQLATIVNYQDMGPLLLEIAGRRLNLFLGNSGTLWSRVATIGTFVTNYLDTLKAQNNSGIQINQEAGDIKIEMLLKLSAKAFQCFSSKDTKQLRIAGQMFDACSYLEEWTKSE